MNNSNSVLTPTNGRPMRQPETNHKGRFDICAANVAATERAVLLVGFDWGTSKSCLKASYAGYAELAAEQIIPTVVG